MLLITKSCSLLSLLSTTCMYSSIEVYDWVLFGYSLLFDACGKSRDYPNTQPTQPELGKPTPPPLNNSIPHMLYHYAKKQYLAISKIKLK